MSSKLLCLCHYNVFGNVFIGLTSLSLLCLLLFSLSLSSFYGLVLWGWGLRTDRVLTALSQPCIAGLF